MWFTLLFGLAAGIIIAYSIMQCYFTYRFHKLPDHQTEKQRTAESFPSLTVIIPFRNEEQSLIKTVKSVLKASRPMKDVEILLIDDHSTDRSSKLAAEFSRSHNNIRHLQAEKFGKKNALAEAINSARSEWIFTADADCIYPKNCIANLFYQVLNKNLDVGGIPVGVFSNSSLIQAYQQLESYGLMLITTVALHDELFYSASGAALLYKKELFQKLQPYKDNYHIQSGDDQFFLYAYRKAINQTVFFYKDSDTIVQTQALDQWQAVIDQRLRWSGKSVYIKDRKLNAILTLTGGADLSALFLIICVVINIKILFGVIILWMLKGGSEGLLLMCSTKYWRNNKGLRFLPAVIIIHPFLRLITVLFYILKRRIYWRGRSIHDQ